MSSYDEVEQHAIRSFEKRLFGGREDANVQPNFSESTANQSRVYLRNESSTKSMDPGAIRVVFLKLGEDINLMRCDI